MTDVTWLPSASALLLGHLCAHVVHVDALRLPSSYSTASGSAPGTHPPSAIITAVSASTRPRSCTRGDPPPLAPTTSRLESRALPNRLGHVGGIRVAGAFDEFAYHHAW